MKPKTALVIFLVVILIMMLASASQYHSVGVFAKDLVEAEKLCELNGGLYWIGVDGDIKCENGALFL